VTSNIYLLVIIVRISDGAVMRHDGVAALAVDSITSVHVNWLCQLIEPDGHYVRISLTPFLLTTL